MNRIEQRIKEVISVNISASHEEGCVYIEGTTNAVDQLSNLLDQEMVKLMQYLEPGISELKCQRVLYLYKAEMNNVDK